MLDESGQRDLRVNQERQAYAISGYPVLGLLLLLLAVGGWLFYQLASQLIPPTKFWVCLLTADLGVFAIGLTGFYMLTPNQAAAIQLFGSYCGTDRATGLRWRWPWLTQTKISTRIHNITSEKLKVNDLRGNPIEIATNVVWRVSDTAKALFDVEDYHVFIDIQIESAVRVIGSRYPYDSLEDEDVTLRGDADEVSTQLERQLQERVDRAGVVIDECRLTHLAYAPEIAQAMLRRQQADAIIAARARIVAGAVGMVEMALNELSKKEIVELDDERRAAMVSNLMVVLCSERDAQPVVNAGSLYQ